MSPDAAQAVDQSSARAAADNSVTASRIYGQLADADVAASAMFRSSNESERQALAATYLSTADTVQRTVGDAVVAAYDDRWRQARLGTVANQLAIYRKVVDDGIEAGRGDNFARQAVLVSAYAREASSYMSSVVLVSVRDLADDERDRLAEARRDAQRWRVAALALPVLILLLLVAVQWWLWRRTRRRLNPGLLAATAAT